MIPCLNESRTIGDVVRGLRPYVRECWVVDDGSTDATGARATQAGAQVLRQESPQGKGAALRAGWSQAAKTGVDWVLLLDGDGQHAPDDTPAFYAAAKVDPGVRMVVGHRLGQPESMPWLRRATNRWMTRRLSSLAGQTLADSQCGFRLVHLPSLLALELWTDCFEIESEMLVAAAWAGLRITFVPIQVRYAGERSKIAPIRDSLRWLRWFGEMRRRRPRLGTGPV